MRPSKITAGPVYLWLSRLLLGVGAHFDFVGASERLFYVDHMRCMVQDHTQIKCGGRMTCWSDFPLHGVYQFKLPRLLDMNSRLFVAVIT
jgi:hypothetical protein